MRKISFIFAAMFLMITIFAVTCNAGECKCRKKSDNLFTKLAWGVVDVIYIPAEFLQTVTCKPYDRGLAADIPSGIEEGFCNMTKRFCGGAYNVATCPVPVPQGYKPIIKEEKQVCGMDNYKGGER